MTDRVTSQQALVPSPLANQARLRWQDGAVVIEWMPRWLASTLNLPDQLPLHLPADKLPGHPLRGILWAVRDMVEQRLPISEFLTEIDTPRGDRLAVLVDGHVDANDPRAAVLMLRDVTEIVRDRRRAAAVGTYHGLIGRSLPMLEVYRRIETYGPTEAPIIITGETGTGKELVARAIHQRSARNEGPYVAVNCTALTPELFESELFGHEKGAFTGAYRQHRGRFERADGGTLFLDEVGDMPLFTQAKLLRALEEGVVERVGGESEHPVDVRVVAATNISLEHSVAGGYFRPDLYHRLSVFRIHLPPLRERTGDIPLLVEYFIEFFNRRYKRQIKRMTPEALRMLEEYTWPGNVRELRNVMERLFVETTGEAIGAKALAGWIAEREYLMPGGWNVDEVYAPRPPIIPQASPRERLPTVPSGPRSAPGGALFDPARAADYWRMAPALPPPLSLTEGQVIIESAPSASPARSESAEKPELTEETLREAFRAAKGNITGAARRLGLHKATLYRHMKRLGLAREDLEQQAPTGEEQ